MWHYNATKFLYLHLHSREPSTHSLSLKGFVVFNLKKKVLKFSLKTQRQQLWWKYFLHWPSSCFYSLLLENTNKICFSFDFGSRRRPTPYLGPLSRWSGVAIVLSFRRGKVFAGQKNFIFLTCVIIRITPFLSAWFQN